MTGTHELDELESASEQLLRPGKAPAAHKRQRSGNRMLAFARGRRRALTRLVRRPPRLLAAVLKYILGPLAALLLVVAIFFPSYTNPPLHYRFLEAQCHLQGWATGCANPNNQSVFISSILYDKGGKLSGGRWGQRILELIDLLGPQNVHLSIYESNSGPEGVAALQRYKELVPCAHTIVSESSTLAGVPNVTMPDGTSRTKRIAFLSDLRNRALRPLDQMREGMPRFDRVLFLNDVAFKPMDAAHLILNTNRGKYLAACALDFGHPWAMYDNYALRDAEGHAEYVNVFPFFGSHGQGISRRDVLAQTDAVRVSGCWGGMISVRGEFVQNTEPRLPRPDFASLDSHVVWPDKPEPVQAPIRFRYEPEPFYDACESCLFPADVATVARRQGAADQGMYVNPYIRTAYSEGIFAWLPWAKRFEQVQRPFFALFALFSERDDQPYRMVGEGDPFTEEMWDNESQQWRLVERRGRSGMFCGVREMQTLRRSKRSHGRNWWDTKQPPGQKTDFTTVWGTILPEDWRKRYDAASADEKFDFFEFDRWGQS
jgi:hypothetical protein